MLNFALADWAILIWVAVGMPLWSWREHRARTARVARDGVYDRLASYNQTLLVLWGTTVAIGALWLAEGRPAAALGLEWGEGLRAAIGWAGAAVVIGLLAVQTLWVFRSEKARADVRKSLAGSQGLQDVMPADGRETVRFLWLSLTAGITEEVIFRGFLIWAFAPVMPVWLAALAALAIFVVLHLYQGFNVSLLKVAATGALLTGLYLLTGSLIPSILLHALIDVTSTLMIWRARQDGAPDKGGAPAGAA